MRKHRRAIGASIDIDAMIRRILSAFSRPPAVSSQPSGAVPSDVRIYAVGDIHGRLDLLEQLLEQIEVDDASRVVAETTVIFLGDLIDRGPDSAQVIQRLLELSKRSGQVRFLLGNHEEVFLKAMAGDPKALPFFVRIGGKPTILSYGISEAVYGASDYPELLDLMRKQIPQAHIDFLSGFEDLIVIGDYVFVHAGVLPGVPLDEQTSGTLRWIREEFLNHGSPFEKIVVHGHTITEQVDERATRIGLDTGAYSSGRLTAMGFEGTNRWVLQTSGPVGQR